MSTPRGQLLYVNLGASQARRRLKGFGHGVRKVQTAGRSQAVIIHTASGGHLRELEALFADVGFSTTESDLGEPIGHLPHLDSTSAEWLRAVGVRTVAQLEHLGPPAAFRLVKAEHPEARINLLWTLEAGLFGKRPQELTDADRERFRRELEGD